MLKDTPLIAANALDIFQRYTSARAWQKREQEGGRWPIHGSTLDQGFSTYSGAFTHLKPTLEQSLQIGFNDAASEQREFVMVDIMADSQFAREVGIGALSSIHVPKGLTIKPYVIGLSEGTKSKALAKIDSSIGLHFEEMIISLPERFGKGLAKMLEGRKIDRAIVKGEGGLQTISPLLFGAHLDTLYRFLNPNGGTMFVEFSLVQAEALPQLESWIAHIRDRQIPIGLSYNPDHPNAVAITRNPNSPESLLPEYTKRRKVIS